MGARCCEFQTETVRVRVFRFPGRTFHSALAVTATDGTVEAFEVTAALRLTAPCVYLCYRGHRRFFDSQDHPDDAAWFFNTMRCIFRRKAACELLCTHSSVAYSKRKPHPGSDEWGPAVQCVAPIGCAVVPYSKQCLLNVCRPRRGPKGCSSGANHTKEIGILTWTSGRATPRKIDHCRCAWLLARG